MDGYGWIAYRSIEPLVQVAYVVVDERAGDTAVKPSPVTQPLPGNGAVEVAQDATLTWTKGDRTTSFDVYVGTDSELGAVDFQGSTGEARHQGAFAPGTVYYWRIDSRNAAGITRGPVWSFTTAGERSRPPLAPTNPDPADGASGVSVDADLSWSSGGRTTTYDVYLGTDATPDRDEHQAEVGTTMFDPGTLAPGTQYFWRVDAINAVGTTEGAVWSFTTAGVADTQPSFGMRTVGNQSYTENTAIAPLTLPQASGGNAPLTYRLTPAVPGLTFNASLRQLTGTPIASGTYHMSYTVSDTDADVDSLTFTVTVAAEVTTGNPLAGTWERTGTIDETYDDGSRASGRLSLTLTIEDDDDFILRILGTGIFFDPSGAEGPFLNRLVATGTASVTTNYIVANVARVIFGNVEEVGLANVSYVLTYTVSNSTPPELSVSGQHIADFCSYTSSICEDDMSIRGYKLPSSERRPSFGVRVVADQSYPENRVIPSLILPLATGGNAPLTYQLTPAVPGLRFDAGPRRLSGTPTAGGQYYMTYTVTDGDGDSDTLLFTITVDDHGDSISDATNLALGGSRTGRIGLADDEDYFRIEMVSSGILEVYTEGRSDTVCTLYDASGFYLADNDDSGNDLNCRISVSVDPGTYYVSVAAFSEDSYR